MRISWDIKLPRCPYCRHRSTPDDFVSCTLTRSEGCHVVRVEFTCGRCQRRFVSSGGRDAWPLEAEPPEPKGEQEDAEWQQALDQITTPDGAREFLNGLSSGADDLGEGDTRAESER